MMRRLFVAEARRMFLERSVIAALLLVIAASAIAITTGVARIQADAANAQAIARDEAERYQKLEVALAAPPAADGAWWADTANPGTAGGHLGARAVILPPAGLGVLAVGDRALHPTAVRIALQPETFADRLDPIENPRNLAGGDFDFVFVIVYVFPLLVLVMAFDLVSGERENGTLPLLRSEAVPFHTLLLAKIAARAVALAGLTMVVVAIGAIAAPAPVSVRALVGAIAGVLVYAAFWFAVALAIQRLQRSSEMNALLGLGAWLFAVLLVPAAANLAVDVLHPTPPRMQLLEQARDAARESSLREGALVARYYEDHPALSPGKGGDDFYKHRTIRDEYIARSLAPLTARFRAQEDNQRGLARRLRLLSPAMLVQAYLEDQAGVGDARQRRFEDQATAFHRQYRAFFESKVMRDQRFSVADVRDIPAFTFEDTNETSTSALVALLLHALALGALAVRGLRRKQWLPV